MDQKQMVKMALIAGASHVLKYKRNNRMASDEEALQQLNREADQIVKNLGSGI